MKRSEQPTLKQLEEYAKATYAPIGYLLLPVPPKEEIPLPDYRTKGGATQVRPSPSLLETIYACQQRQEWFRDYARLHRLPELGFVGSVTTKNDPVAVGTTIRKTLGFSLDAQVKAKDWEDALTQFIVSADEAGVLMMRNGIVGANTHRALDPDEFRGFALADSTAPLVFVNAADTKAAQMFTVAHELAHIWLGQSSLDDLHQGDKQTEVERWCNQVAAETLVPLLVFEKETGAGRPLRGEMDRLSKMFKVSTLVILYRMADAGVITRRQMSEAYAHEAGRLAEMPGSSGGNFYTTQIARVGRRFGRAVVIDTLEGNTLHRDAFRMLGLSNVTFDRFGQQVGVT